MILTKFHLSRDLIRFHRKIHISSYLKKGTVKNLLTRSPPEESKGPRITDRFGLNLSTVDRITTLTIPVQQVESLVKYGMIPPNASALYIHHIADVCKSSEDPEDRDFYSRIAFRLMQSLLSRRDSLPEVARRDLIVDIAETSPENCKKIHDDTKLYEELMLSESTEIVNRLLETLYKFGLWDEADKFYADTPIRLILGSVFDSMCKRLLQESVKYGQNETDEEELRAKCLKHLSLVLHFGAKHNLKLSSDALDVFVTALKNFGLEVVENPKIKQNGKCLSCNSHLRLFDSNATSTVNSIVEKNLLAKSDRIYMKTDIEEFENFKSALDRINQIDKRPITCVLDGLNLAYKISNTFLPQKVLARDRDIVRSKRIRDPAIQTQVLLNIIIRNDLLHRFRKIFVILRKHMRNWTGLNDGLERLGIHYYHLDNKSDDDLFQLYAATKSPHAIVISNDNYRDFMQNLPDHERSAILNWLDTHQGYVSPNALEVVLPNQVLKSVSIDAENGCFHVPIYNRSQVERPLDTKKPMHANTDLYTWICCRSEYLKEILRL